MSPIKPRRHILLHRAQAFPCDDLGPNGGLDRDLEELTGNDFFCGTVRHAVSQITVLQSRDRGIEGLLSFATHSRPIVTADAR